jgi:hypothetical protein
MGISSRKVWLADDYNPNINNICNTIESCALQNPLGVQTQGRLMILTIYGDMVGIQLGYKKQQHATRLGDEWESSFPLGNWDYGWGANWEINCNFVLVY